MRLSSDLKKLLLRTLLFVTLFVLASGSIGPWVISTDLLYGFNFFIYGNLGKLVIFSVIIFIILTRDKIHTLKVDKFSAVNAIYLVAAAIQIPLFFSLGNKLLSYTSFTQNLPLRPNGSRKTSAQDGRKMIRSICIPTPNPNDLRTNRRRETKATSTTRPTRPNSASTRSTAMS